MPPLACRLIRYFACLVFIAAMLPAEEPSRPEFAISVFDVGAVDQVRAREAELANELNSQEWCVARPLATNRGWTERPAGTDAGKWVSIVTVGFGKRAEAYAFQFSPQGQAKLLAHVPHRKTLIRGVEQWSSPFVKLLSGLRVGYAESPSQDETALQLEIVEVAGEKSAPSKKTLDDALTLSPDKVLPPLRVIATAAACAAGWSPTTQPAASRARLEVRVLDQACAFRITLTHDGRETVVARERVPWEEYHDQLALLFRLPRLGPHVVDFVRPHPSKVELLGVEGNRVVCLVDDELTGLDAATGAEAWQVRIPQSKLPTAPKRIERYTTRQDARGALRIFRWTTSLAEVASTDGKLTPLVPVPAASAFGFDVADNGNVAVVQANRLTLFAQGREAWTTSEASPITCGPRCEPDRILFGTERGDLVAVARGERRELWRVTLGKRLAGPITAAKGLRLAFSNESESLAAIDPHDGAVKWSFAAGDVLVQPPVEQENSLVVVTKQNRLARLDPASGDIQYETRWPTWIVSAQPLELGGTSRLAVADVSGKLTFVGRELRPIWETRLGSRLTGRAAIAVAPAVWKGMSASKDEDLLETIAADAAGTKRFVLTSDAGGFLYKLAEGKTAD